MFLPADAQLNVSWFFYDQESFYKNMQRFFLEVGEVLSGGLDSDHQSHLVAIEENMS